VDESVDQEVIWIAEASSASADAFADDPVRHDDLVYFPEVIQTSEDSPVLLNRLVDISDEPGGDSGITIVAIDGVDVSSPAVAGLPGIRVGVGEGVGYVFRRDLDGQLVFSPDTGFSGVTAFTYTIADAFGETATLVATLSVAAGEDEAEIVFADGTQSARIAAGVDAAIIGALSFEGLSDGTDPFTVSVFEGDSEVPSERFVVSGDKLQLSGGVDRTLEDAISLRIVASVDGLAVATGAFDIEVQPAETGSFRSDTGGAIPTYWRPTLVYSSGADHAMRAGADQLTFDRLMAELANIDLSDDDLLEMSGGENFAGDAESGLGAIESAAGDAGLTDDVPLDPATLLFRGLDAQEF
jgi:hypothetical protein